MNNTTALNGRPGYLFFLKTFTLNSVFLFFYTELVLIIVAKEENQLNNFQRGSVFIQIYRSKTFNLSK